MLLNYNKSIRDDVPLLIKSVHGIIPENFKWIKECAHNSRTYVILRDKVSGNPTRILELDFVLENNSGFYWIFAPYHFKSLDIWYEVLTAIESDLNDGIIIEENWQL